MINVRPMISAATAVAARIASSQNHRPPRTRKAPGILEGPRAIAADGRSDADRPPAAFRRTGESQGRIVLAWRLWSTPERP
jgi:hypothetical protein